MPASTLRRDIRRRLVLFPSPPFSVFTETSFEPLCGAHEDEDDREKYLERTSDAPEGRPRNVVLARTAALFILAQVLEFNNLCAVERFSGNCSDPENGVKYTYHTSRARQIRLIKREHLRHNGLASAMQSRNF